VDRVDRKDGGRKYRVHYTGYDDPADDRWYDEEQLREMGRNTAKMLRQGGNAKAHRATTRGRGGATVRKK
jgi:hypothetical protein